MMQRTETAYRSMVQTMDSDVPFARSEMAYSPASVAPATFTPPEQMAYDKQTGKPVTITMPVYDTATAVPETVDQWHLGYLGDIVAIWNDFTGKGMRIGALDEGI